jgi:hypothetical protein
MKIFASKNNIEEAVSRGIGDKLKRDFSCLTTRWNASS